jgi:hypothetical protein
MGITLQIVGIDKDFLNRNPNIHEVIARMDK